LPQTDGSGLPAFAALGGRSGRLERDRSLLLVVDIQERLAPHVADADALIARTQALLAAARLFAIPVLATEHCADRIGPLIARLKSSLQPHEIYAKTRFGGADHADFVDRLARSARSQVVIAGMEAHVCVMQTALGVAVAGYEVFVVADAVGSRTVRPLDRTLALERMRSAGCTLVATETALFEWTGAGDDAAFGQVLALVKSLP
jgi:nicotinamidase-related amidase